MDVLWQETTILSGSHRVRHLVIREAETKKDILSLNRFATLPFSICRIYDPNSGALVQSYTGHQDSIKGLIHVPEMKQVGGPHP